MKNIILLVFVLMILVGCTQTTEVPLTQISAEKPTEQPTNTKISPTDTPVPTATKVPPTEVPPTDTPEPTATLESPTTTPLPEGMLFRDDFEGEFQSGWEWINEVKANWAFVEQSWLEIIGGDVAFYTEGEYGMSNFLIREIPEGEFVITAHIQSNPSENFQQAAIYIFEDQDNYIALNIGYCEPCQIGGPGYFMETFIDNNPFDDAYQIKRSAEETDVYLRLVNQGGSVTGYYATTLGEWQRIGAFGNYFDFKYVGLGTTNSNPNGVEQNIVSRFDYFEISVP